MAIEFQVSFGKKTANFLNYIAECQGKTVSKLIRRLVFEALETRELCQNRCLKNDNLKIR